MTGMACMKLLFYIMKYTVLNNYYVYNNKIYKHALRIHFNIYLRVFSENVLFIFTCRKFKHFPVESKRT